MLGVLQSNILLQVSKAEIKTATLLRSGAKILGIKQKITSLENDGLIVVDKDGIALTELGKKHQFGNQAGQYEVEDAILKAKQRRI